MTSFTLTIFVTIVLAEVCQASSISLIIENGTQSGLNGSFCPGTTRLVCNAINLPFLQWRFNENMLIEAYFSDDSPSGPMALFGYPAFDSVQLLDIQRDTITSMANYTSTLTVNIAGLYNQGIYEISCTNGIVSDAIDVNVTIVLTDPPRPNITTLEATYQDSILLSLRVSWMPVETECPLSISYSASLDSGAPQNIPHSSCGAMCSFSFSNFSDGESIVSVRASSLLTGNGMTSTFSGVFGTLNGEYFTPSIVADGGVPVGLCQHVSGDFDTCTIRYSTDPTLTNSVNALTVAVNSTSLIPDLVPCTQYYFEISANVDKQLVVIQKLNLLLDTNPTPLGGEAVLIILSLVILMLSILLASLLVYFAVRPHRIYIAKSLLLLDILLLVTSFLSIFFLISWIGIVSDGICRVDWFSLRISLLVICFIWLTTCLVAQLFILCCSPCALRVEGKQKNSEEKSTQTMSCLVEEEAPQLIYPTPALPPSKPSHLFEFMKTEVSFIHKNLKKRFGSRPTSQARSKEMEASVQPQEEKPDLFTELDNEKMSSKEQQPSPEFDANDRLQSFYQTRKWVTQPPTYRHVSVQVAVFSLSTNNPALESNSLKPGNANAASINTDLNAPAKANQSKDQQPKLDLAENEVTEMTHNGGYLQSTLEVNQQTVGTQSEPEHGAPYIIDTNLKLALYSEVDAEEPFIKDARVGPLWSLLTDKIFAKSKKRSTDDCSQTLRGVSPFNEGRDLPMNKRISAHSREEESFSASGDQHKEKVQENVEPPNDFFQSKEQDVKNETTL